VAVTTALWLLMHGAFLALAAGQVRDWRLAGAAGLMVLACVTATLVPWWRGVRLGPAATAAVVVACPTFAVLNLVAIRPEDLSGYANIASGSAGLVLAGLVMHARTGAAVVAGVALVVAQTVVVVVAPGPFDLLTAVYMAVPPELWLVGAIAVRWLLRGGDLLVAELDQRREVLLDEAPARAAWEAERAARLDGLERTVIPFLEHVAQGRADEADRARASGLAVVLRDDLRARHLLDATVREAVAAARTRGVAVTLAAEGDPGTVEDVVRRALPAVLAQPGLTDVSVRVLPDGTALGVLHASAVDEVAAALRALDGAGVTTAVTVDVEAGVALVRVEPVRGP